MGGREGPDGEVGAQLEEEGSQKPRAEELQEGGSEQL